MPNNSIPQRQDGLVDQLETVIKLATEAGCYDAVDWIRQRLAETRPPADEISPHGCSGA